MTTMTAWNVRTLTEAVNEALGVDNAAVSWANGLGKPITRSGRGRKPPRLRVGVVIEGGTEVRLKELPGCLRLMFREEDPWEEGGEPRKIITALFATEPR